MIAAPVQKTALMPSGFFAAHDDSASGTMAPAGHLARVLQAPRERDLTHGERDDERVQPHDSDEDAVDEAHQQSDAEAREDRDGKRSFDWSPTPTMRFAPRNITPGVERSMPPCMTTSIWPSAATASIVMYGRTNAQDAL